MQYYYLVEETEVRRSPRPTSKKAQTPKIVDIPPALPKRPYDKTDEETNADVAAQVQAHFAPKKPEPKTVYDEKTKKWAKSFLEQPSQISMNLESDYDREIIKQEKKKKAELQNAGSKLPNLNNRRINRSPRSKSFQTSTRTSGLN